MEKELQELKSANAALKKENRQLKAAATKQKKELDTANGRLARAEEDHKKTVQDLKNKLNSANETLDGSEKAKLELSQELEKLQNKQVIELPITKKNIDEVVEGIRKYLAKLKPKNPDSLSIRHRNRARIYIDGLVAELIKFTEKNK